MGGFPLQQFNRGPRGGPGVTPPTPIVLGGDVRSITRSFTKAELQTANTSPIVLLTPQSLDGVIAVLQFQWKARYSTPQTFSNNPNVGLRYQGIAQDIVTATSGGAATVNGRDFINLRAPAISYFGTFGGNDATGLPVIFWASSNFTAGAGQLLQAQVRVVYTEFGG